MKKFSKIASIFMAIALAVATPVVLTGCGPSELSLKEGSRAMVVAGDNYYTNHVDYENFADSTVGYKSNYSSTSVHEVEYKASAGATETTKANFTDTTNGTEELKMVVKNVSLGEGESAVKDLHVVVTKTTNETKKEYFADDETGLLKEETTTTVEVTTYTLAYIVTDGEPTYYVTCLRSTKENSNDPVVSKEYYEFADRAEYMDAVAEYLSATSKLVAGSYFGGEMGEMLLLLGSFSKDGDKVYMEVAYSMPEVSKYGSMLISISLKTGFDGKKLGEAEGSLSMETVDKGNYNADAKLTFNESAEAVSISIDGYEDAGVLLEGDYLIPESLVSLGMM